eukprot:CAMPEP_0195060124 /NCGR_PEP_ID=MMETSP0448-20130528/7464_1 /TAXON_ID=66468 /ORGANISM="Heterocapsa triquestra, Strain CCMP 448" /LENGTH=102 /DNA_ID=CAMNT_0040090493 /DNA_START=91 /DNA_END=396 /DNA_ORIENTATION=+
MALGQHRRALRVALEWDERRREQVSEGHELVLLEAPHPEVLLEDPSEFQCCISVSEKGPWTLSLGSTYCQPVAGQGGPLAFSDAGGVFAGALLFAAGTEASA